MYECSRDTSLDSITDRLRCRNRCSLRPLQSASGISYGSGCLPTRSRRLRSPLPNQAGCLAWTAQCVLRYSSLSLLDSGLDSQLAAPDSLRCRDSSALDVNLSWLFFDHKSFAVPDMLGRSLCQRHYLVYPTVQAIHSRMAIEALLNSSCRKE